MHCVYLSEVYRLKLALFQYVNEDGGKLNAFNCVLGFRAGLQCWNPILEQMCCDGSGFSVCFFFFVVVMFYLLPFQFCFIVIILLRVRLGNSKDTRVVRHFPWKAHRPELNIWLVRSE